MIYLTLEVVVPVPTWNPMIVMPMGLVHQIDQVAVRLVAFPVAVASRKLVVTIDAVAMLN